MSACLLTCMMAEPFPNRLGYDILLRPWFAPLDLSFDRRTCQILNQPLRKSVCLWNTYRERRFLLLCLGYLFWDSLFSRLLSFASLFHSFGSQKG
jgi:hypothetical protein